MILPVIQTLAQLAIVRENVNVTRRPNHMYVLLLITVFIFFNIQDILVIFLLLSNNYNLTQDL